VDFIELVKQRRSIRKYKDDKVPEEKLKIIFDAARLAPSWLNKQCWSFVVVEDPQIKKKLAEIAGQTWLSSAPIIIVGCGDPDVSGKKGDQEYYMVDVGIAMEHLILAATEQGLGTCWIGSFEEEKVKEILGVPGGMRVVAMTPLGFPDEQPKAKPRKPIRKIFFHNKMTMDVC
jgi:nitroreductase